MSFNTLVTSRQPDDWTPFCGVMCQVFAGQAKGNARLNRAKPAPLGHLVASLNLMASRL